MKGLIAFLVGVLCLAGVNAFAASSTYGNCSILYPLQNDNQQQYCANNTFGVAYNGYFAANACYDTINDAINAMDTNPACTLSDHVGYCRILYPLQNDNQQQYCGTNTFGITYNGYFTANACYSSVDAAITAMDSDSACNMPDTLGPCKILYPLQNDNQQKYCGTNTYGVVYNGYLTSNTCYTSIDGAINAMTSDPACH